jgi:hypothetical protein
MPGAFIHNPVMFPNQMLPSYYMPPDAYRQPSQFSQ